MTKVQRLDAIRHIIIMAYKKELREIHKEIINKIILSHNEFYNKYFTDKLHKQMNLLLSDIIAYEFTIIRFNKGKIKLNKTIAKKIIKTFINIVLSDFKLDK